MKITAKIIKKYLKNPDNCPFCDNKEGKGLYADNNDITPESSVLWRNISCNDCGRGWTEEFKLSLIDNLIEKE